MFSDARQISQGSEIQTGICIIGAGAAGITLAREFIGSSADICMVESGGIDYASDVQLLARGRNIGLPYPDLEATRVRQLGGSTNHWGGECRPLDREDFAVRDWIPGSGWPITLADMVPYYRRAASVVETGAYDRYMAGWAAVEQFPPAFRALQFSPDRIVPRVFQNSPPTRFGTRYRAELEAPPNLRVLLNANFVAFETDEARRTVRRIRLATLGGRSIHVGARTFVLATGTIENARLLLAAGDGTASFGNQSDAVGRFFQEHVAHQWLASLIPSAGLQMSDLDQRREGAVGLAFTEAAQKELKLPNVTIFLDARREGADSSGVQSARKILGGLQTYQLPEHLFDHVRQVLADLPAVTRYAYRRVAGTEDPLAFVEVGFVSEQIPNPDSRVRLIPQRDALGLPIAELDWRLTDLDRQAMLRALDYIVRDIGVRGLGRVKVMVPEDGADWLDRISMSFHPMGTTRMHSDPRHGVVDADCRVHGMDNLYLAGSSVFPTSGAGSPTYTIVALALRLADHLKRQAI